MGRKKIRIERIPQAKNRQVTFNKRKLGLMKKAMELSVLCDCEVALLIFSGDKLFQYSSSDVINLITRFSSHEGSYECLTNQDFDAFKQAQNARKEEEGEAQESNSKSKPESLLAKRKFSLSQLEIPNTSRNVDDAEGLLLLSSPVVKTADGTMSSDHGPSKKAKVYAVTPPTNPMNGYVHPSQMMTQCATQESKNAAAMCTISPYGWPGSPFLGQTGGLTTPDAQSMIFTPPALSQQASMLVDPSRFQQQLQLQQMLTNSMTRPMSPSNWYMDAMSNQRNGQLINQVNKMNQISHLAQLSQLLSQSQVFQAAAAAAASKPIVKRSPSQERELEDADAPALEEPTPTPAPPEEKTQGVPALGIPSPDTNTPIHQPTSTKSTADGEG